jgi:hypothetical protein
VSAKIDVNLVPRRQTIHNLVNKFKSTGLLIDKKQEKGRALTEEKLDDIGARLDHTPRNSLKRLAQETGVSMSNARRATQLLKLIPYRTKAIHVLQLCDPGAGFIFAAAFYSLSSKVRSIHNWHSLLMKCGFTCRDT